MLQESTTKNEMLEIGPPLRLVGMTWISILIIYFLPLGFWFLIFKIFLALFVVIVIRGSFQPVWDSYETMGAFVTMQTTWFIGLLWVPESFLFLKYLFIFLIVLGLATKFKQIKHINKGLGPDLSRDFEHNEKNTKNNDGLIFGQAKKKQENKSKIQEFLKDNEKITNNDVEKLLGVSDATATRYLNELEKEQKIKQIGETGQGVYYRLV